MSSTPSPAGNRYRSDRIAVNSLWNVIDTFVGLTCAMAVSVLVARHFGPELLGYYSYIMWLVAMTSLVGRTGLPTAARRYLAQYVARNDMVRTRLFFNVLLAAQTGIALITVLISLVWVWYAIPVQYRVVGILGVIGILPSMVLSIITAFNSALERLEPNAKASMISMVVYLAGILVALRLDLGLVGVILPLLISKILDLALRVWFSRRWLAALYREQAGVRVRLEPEEKRELVHFVVQAVLLQGLAVVVWDRSEMIFLKQFSPIAQLAFYSIPFTITQCAFVVQSAFGTASSTSLFVIYAEDVNAAQSMLRTTVKYMALIAFPICIGLSAVSNPLLSLMYGPKYEPAIAVMAITAAFGAARGLFIPAEQFLVVANQQKLLIYVTIGSAIVDLGLCWFLIPGGGAVGAAWCNSAAQVTALALIWIVIRKSAGIAVDWPAVGRVLVCAVAMGLASAAAAQIRPHVAGLTLAVLTGVVTYTVALRLFGGLDQSDFRRLLILAERLPGRLQPLTKAVCSFVTKGAGAAGQLDRTAGVMQ